MISKQATWENFYEEIPYGPKFASVSDVFAELKAQGYSTFGMKLFAKTRLDDWEEQGLIMSKLMKVSAGYENDSITMYSKLKELPSEEKKEGLVLIVNAV